MILSIAAMQTVISPYVGIELDCKYHGSADHRSVIGRGFRKCLAISRHEKMDTYVHLVDQRGKMCMHDFATLWKLFLRNMLTLRTYRYLWGPIPMRRSSLLGVELGLGLR